MSLMKNDLRHFVRKVFGYGVTGWGRHLTMVGHMEKIFFIIFFGMGGGSHGSWETIVKNIFRSEEHTSELQSH